MGERVLDGTDKLIERILEALRAVAVSSTLEPPERCRAVIVNDHGDSILAVRRERPNKPPYTVLPGGGVETYDTTPVETVYREVTEESGIRRDQFLLRENVVVVDGDHWLYVGRAQPGVMPSGIGGPEAGRDVAVSGTYKPEWVPLADLEKVNFIPTHIGHGLLTAYQQTT